ncbi:MAG: NAD(P)/FAD-dependent oxidoreductase [Candidatus Saganbacteria bacterium]|nr:NAD(P)/FAD-dependent oxidoreductase [Candidatus Saganbacteria bacterium]
MRKKIVVIIGAGPAGTSAAIQLAQAGFSPLIVDKDNFPRDKVCGDAVSGEGLLISETFGLLEELEQEGYKCEKREFYTDQTELQIINKKAINIPREKFDLMLFKKALSLGAEFMCAEFSGKVTYKDGYHSVELLNPGKEKFLVDCEYLIIATGCQSDLALRELGRKHKIACPDQVAYRGYYRAKWPIKERKYFFLRELTPGYAWIFPLGKGLFNVGCGGKILKARKLELKDCLSRFVSKTNALYKCTGVWEKEPKGAPLRSNFSNLINFKGYPNLILIGEAMGATYPFSGGGIGKSMLSAVLAAESVMEVVNKKGNHCLSKVYQNKINKKMKPKYYTFFKFCDYLLTSSFLQKFVYEKVFNSKKYPDLIPNILCGKIRPERLFSIPFVIGLGLQKKR